MTVTRLANSITFAVDDVEPVLSAKPTWKAHEGINALLTESEEKGFVPILSCSGYNSNTIRQVTNHSVIAAIHTAFAEHRPLTLSPDMLWITIMQGVAQHVRNNPDQLRKRLVNHQGKMEIAVSNEGFEPDSPESDWPGVINQLGDGLKANIGDAYDELMCNFSTTGDMERIVCAISILDIYEPYFEYVMYCVCGIPSITLEGSVSDWRTLREKIEVLAHFEMDWWLDSLRPIFDHFVRAAEGDIDLPYWQNIYKLKKAYGWERMNGWAVRLFPYLRHGQTGSFTVRNYMLESPFVIEPNEEPEEERGFGANVSGVVMKDMPSGLSVVPLKIVTATGPIQYQLIGGFVGIEQEEGSNALRPKLGWAVRKTGGIDGLLSSVPPEHRIIPPLSTEQFEKGMVRLADRPQFGGMALPGEITTFYRKCNGIEFGATGSEASNAFGKFRSVLNLERIGLPRDKTPPRANPLTEREQFFEDLELDKRDWLVFFDLPDGSFLAMDIDPPYVDRNTKQLKAVRRFKDEHSWVVYKDISEALGVLLKHGNLV